MTQNSDALREVVDRYERTQPSEGIGRPYRFESTVTSTNAVAREWALDGGPHGALVFADGQTRGRGRRGRTWQTQPGLNLTFSLILRPGPALMAAGLITLGAGLAMFETLKRLFSVLNIQIKWPNDILINSSKCAGSLLESSIGSNGLEKFVILGIGLNVNQTAFPPDLAQTATSLFLETGHQQDRIGLLVALLGELEIRLDQISQDRNGFMEEYESHLAGMGSAIRLDTFDRGSTVSGTFLGITESGSMRIRTPAGVQEVYAGDVTFDTGEDSAPL